MRSPLAVLLVAAALLAPGAASAAEPPAASGDNTVLAGTLFEQGRKLMEAKQYAEACPKFEESMRLRPGSGTLLNLALCNEALGKTATAWAQFKEVLFTAKKENDEAREAFAQEHIDALEPRLSKVQIQAAATPGLVIRRDGQEIPAAALSTPIPVDPGAHTLDATAPGYTVWSTRFEIRGDAEVKTVAIPQLTPVPAEPPPRGAAPDATGPDGSAQRTVGLVVGGVGVAALGLGAVLGIMASGEASDAEADPALCPAKRCTPAGREVIDGASTKALVSTIGFGVGAAAIGAGLALFLTAAPSPPAAERARLVPLVGLRGGGLGVAGAF